MAASETALLRTPLHALHRELGAKFVPFAGYEMPVQYPSGVLAEHLHTRAKAGLFDVSHMGQVSIAGRRPDVALEALVPGDIQALGPLRMRYTQLTNEVCGIRDDLMVTRRGEGLFVVVNAANKAADLVYLQDNLAGANATELVDFALLALQGPAAVAVMAALAPDLAALPFMTGAEVSLDSAPCFVTRSGYTGEDGFEISVPAEHAEALARRLLDHPDVAPIGLGARDSLRLEAGLCLHGHDIDETTTVVEAALTWSVSARRRQLGEFPGADLLRQQLDAGPPRRRVGILPTGKAPAREGTVITDGARPIGIVTSGGFGPTRGGPVAMGYVETGCASPGTAVTLLIRDKPHPAAVAAMPFVPHRYFRGAAA